MRNLLILFFITLFRVSAQDANGNPVIFNVSQTASAGDVIYLQGSGFGSSPRVEYSYTDSNWTSLGVLTSGSNSALVQIPTNQTRLPDLLTVRISQDGSHWSSPAFINQAKAMSFDTNQVGPGNRFRIFGRNLIFSRTAYVSLVDTANGTAHSAYVDGGSSTAYALSVLAPSDIQAGHTYNVYVSNGYNGNSSSGAVTMAPTTIAGRYSGGDFWGLGVPWAADLNFTGNIYNIQNDPRLSLHAYGGGSPSDIYALQQAIYIASNAGGGIVYLPAGTYNLYFANGCGLTLMPRVVLMGQGASNTFVNYGFGSAPSSGQGGWAVCLVNAQSGASDITFTNVNQSGQWPQNAASLNTSEVFLQRTNWNLSTGQWLSFQNDSNVTIQNSNIVQGLDPSYNGPLSLLGSNNFIVRGNNIKYVAGTLLFDRTTNGVFENNTVTRDASQSAPSWVITHVVVGSFTNNFMVLHNSFGVSGGNLPLQNDGETIGSEAGGAIRQDEFRGTVAGADNYGIYDPNQNFNYSTNNAVPNLHVGSILAIVSGVGAGEWSTVSSISSDGHIVWVDKPFPVVPGNGSTYATFDWSAANWTIAGNIMSNNEKGIEFFNSSIRDVLITGNSMTNNGEILLSPTEQPYGAGMLNLILNTQILNNNLVDNNYQRPAAISAVSREDSQVSNVGNQIIGLEVRNNSITGTSPNTVISQTSLDDAKALSEGLNVYWQWQTDWSNYVDNGTASIVGTVLQGNTLNNSSVGLHLNSGVSQTVLAANKLNNVSGTQVNTTIPGASHAAVGTVSLSTSNIAVTSATNVWNQLTIGSLAHSSLASETADTTSFSLNPSLYYISNGGDSLSMLAQSMPQDGTIIARISVPTNASSAAQGEVTIRDSSSPLAAFVSLGQLQNGYLMFQWRCFQNGTVGGYTYPHAQTPMWVKLEKTDTYFQAFYSDDGSTWNYAGIIGADIRQSGYYIGLESLSNSTSGPAISFTGVDIN